MNMVSMQEFMDFMRFMTKTADVDVTYDELGMPLRFLFRFTRQE